MTSMVSSQQSATASTAKVTALYHPTLGVGDLEAARIWFRKVFELPDLRWEDTLDLSLLEPDYPVNYSFFMFIKDFHFVVLCPELHARGALAGQSRYQGVPDSMIGIGWYTDDAVGMFERLQAHGFPSHDQKGQLISAQNRPVSSIAPDILVGFTFPEQAGMRHEFEELGARHHAYYSLRADPRLRPDWKLPEVDPRDPLGIVRSSHHTIATGNLARALSLYVETAGGTVLGTSRNVERAGTSTYVRLADAVVEFLVPDAGSVDAALVAQGMDAYLGITLQVADLQKVSEHLNAVGVPVSFLSEGVVGIEPLHAFGMQWRFVTARPYAD